MSARKFTAMGTLVVLAGGTIFILPTIDRNFGESLFNQIREGMTEREVERIIGHPAGDYRPQRYKKPGHFVSSSDPIGFTVKCSGLSPDELAAMEQKDLTQCMAEGTSDKRRKVAQKLWLFKSWGIVVALDEKGLVIHHRLLETVPPRAPDELFSKLKWYLGL